MKTLFDSPNVSDGNKSAALELALNAANTMNRFAAMDTCQAMITSVQSDGLAILVRDIIMGIEKPFIYNIDPVNCKHDTIVAPATTSLLVGPVILNVRYLNLGFTRTFKGNPIFH